MNYFFFSLTLLKLFLYVYKNGKKKKNRIMRGKGVHLISNQMKFSKKKKLILSYSVEN